jgi:hypothetical protein
MITTATLPTQTSLQGTVSDEETGDPTIGAEVVLHQQGIFIAKAIADFDGAYFFTDLAPGSYAVTASYVGFEDVRIKKFRVKAGKVNRLDLVFKKPVTYWPVIIHGGDIIVRTQIVQDSTQPLQKQ